jgi:hypothetical protein
VWIISPVANVAVALGSAPMSADTNMSTPILLTNSEEENVARIAVMGAKNGRGFLYLTGSAAATITETNYVGTQQNQWIYATEGYNQNLGVITNPNNLLPNVRWFHIANDTEKEGNYSSSLTADVLATLKPGQKALAERTENQAQINLQIPEPGVYMFIYDDLNPGVHTVNGLIDPNQNPITIQTSAPLLNHVIFCADQVGVYVLFMTLGYKYVQVELKKLSTMDGELNTVIEYKEETQGVKIGEIINIAEQVQNVYKFPVEAGKWYRSYARTVWGPLAGMIFMPTANGYVGTGLNVVGTEQTFYCSENGYAYISTLKMEEGSWTPSFYRMSFSEELVTQVEIGTTTRLRSTALGEPSIYSLTVNESKFLVFNATNIQNGQFAITNGQPANFLMYEFNEALTFQREFAAIVPNSHYGYFLKAGTYFFGLTDSDNQEDAIVDLQIREVAIENGPYTAIPSGQTFNITTDYTSFPLSNNLNLDGNGKSQTFPQPLTVDLPKSYFNDISLMLNLTNYPWFNEYLPAAKLFTYNASDTNVTTQYQEISYTGGILPMFQNYTGGMNGDRFIMAFNNKTRVVDLILSDLATTNNFSIMIYDDGFGWRPMSWLTGYEDATHDGNNSLAKSGRIKFNLTGKHGDYIPTANGTGLPKTATNYYWISIVCNSTTPLSVIPSISAMPTGNIYRELNGTLNYYYGYESPFDQIYSYLISSQTPNFALSLDNPVFMQTWNTAHSILSQRKGLITVYATNLIEGWNSEIPANPFFGNLDVQVAFGDRNSEILYVPYDITGSKAFNPVLNMTAYNTFSKTTNVNGSIYKYLVYEISNAQQFDWMQINSRLQNNLNATYNYNIYWNMPWTVANTYPTSSSWLRNLANTQFDITSECGTFLPNFDIRFEIKQKALLSKLFLYNATDTNVTTAYADVSDFVNPLTMFQDDGDINGDRVIFGFRDKPDVLDIILQNAAVNDSFRWQYFDPGNGWVNIPNIYDTTWVANNSLGKSGQIAWALNAGWYTNPSSFGLTANETGLPRTELQYYWLAVRCNSTNVSVIPTMLHHDYNVINKLWVGGYNIPLLSMSYNLTYTPEPEPQVPKGIDPMLFVYIGVPAAVVAGAIIGIIIWKKKHPI